MTMRDRPRRASWRRRGVWIAALVALVVGCSDDRRLADRGIGGTGVTDGGIGGTGIVGTITGFGSILVNGLRIEYDARTPVSADLGEATAGDLRVGQVVAVEAATVNRQLVARSIALRTEVSGPLTQVSEGGRGLQIMGQAVVIDAASIARGGGLDPTELAVGQWVTVSGLRDADGFIVATRIDSRRAGGLVGVRGPVDGDGGGLRIGSLELAAPPGLAFERGRTTFVAGELVAGGTLAVRRAVPEPFVPFGGRLATISVEGFVRGLQDSVGFTIGARSVRFASAAVGRTVALAPGTRVYVTGRSTAEGGIIATQVENVSAGAAPAPRPQDVDRPAQPAAPGAPRSGLGNPAPGGESLRTLDREELLRRLEELRSSRPNPNDPVTAPAQSRGPVGALRNIDRGEALRRLNELQNRPANTVSGNNAGGNNQGSGGQNTNSGTNSNNR
jgi:hypothetical protein